MLQRVKRNVGRRLSRTARSLGYFREGGLRFRPIAKQKVFCIGRNKTGTTSLKKALSEFGYLIGDQRAAERLIDAYAIRDFGPIMSYCETAEAFQDVPFSWPYTYVVLDQAFPNSKFILTVRSGGW